MTSQLNAKLAKVKNNLLFSLDKMFTNHWDVSCTRIKTSCVYLWPLITNICFKPAIDLFITGLVDEQVDVFVVFWLLYSRHWDFQGRFITGKRKSNNINVIFCTNPFIYLYLSIVWDLTWDPLKDTDPLNGNELNIMLQEKTNTCM